MGARAAARKVALIAVAATGIVAASGGAAFAEMTNPPDCEQGQDGGCVTGPGGMHGGSPDPGTGSASPDFGAGGFGRTFVSDDDVVGWSKGGFTMRFVPSQWDSLDDLEAAGSMYWHLRVDWGDPDDYLMTTTWQDANTGNWMLEVTGRTTYGGGH